MPRLTTLSGGVSHFLRDLQSQAATIIRPGIVCSPVGPYKDGMLDKQAILPSLPLSFVFVL